MLQVAKDMDPSPISLLLYYQLQTRQHVYKPRQTMHTIGAQLLTMGASPKKSETLGQESRLGRAPPLAVTGVDLCCSTARSLG